MNTWAARWGVVTVLGLALAAVPVIAEDPIRTSLDSSSARNFMGDWALSIDFNGRAIEVGLKVVDLEGKVGATIDSPQQPEALAVEDISIDERGHLVLKYPLTFGQQSFKVTLTAILIPDGLEGTLVEDSGLFEAAFTGKEAFEDAETSGQRRRNRRMAASQARLRFGSDSVQINFHPLAVNSDDHKRLGELKDGDVFEFVGGRATKLMTDVNMDFAGTTIATENAAPDYPGVYSLWLKKTATGWNLLFNEEADIWGTMYNPDATKAEIALTQGAAAEASDTFKVLLEEATDGGVLKIVWGEAEWSAAFNAKAAEEKAAAQ